MNFRFLSTPTFEAWDWTNPDKVGIGGSETSHIEMSNRLSNRGHEVTSFGPTPFLGPVKNLHGVEWQRSDKVDFTKPGIWVIYRDPEIITEVPQPNPVWLVCQDIDYPGKLLEKGLDRVTRIIALCKDHAIYLAKRYPKYAHKICVSSNGIKREVIEKVLENPPERNPKRFMYASSPDRGLWYLVMIFNRLREIVSDVELHVCYGFDNMEKLIAKDSESWMAKKSAQLIEMMEAPGIFHHGRVPQTELAIEWAKSGIWCHPSVFPETSCITCMDAQALGAVPITNPVWAVGENVEHGIFIDGDTQAEALVRARYVLEAMRLAIDPDRQERIRKVMMPWALERFDWEVYVKQWELWAMQDWYSLVEASNADDDARSQISRLKHQGMEVTA